MNKFLILFNILFCFCCVNKNFKNINSSLKHSRNKPIINNLKRNDRDSSISINLNNEKAANKVQINNSYSLNYFTNLLKIKPYKLFFYIPIFSSLLCNANKTKFIDSPIRCKEINKHNISLKEITKKLELDDYLDYKLNANYKYSVSDHLAEDHRFSLDFKINAFLKNKYAQRLFILGDTNSGKTTYLKFLNNKFINEYNNDKTSYIDYFKTKFLNYKEKEKNYPVFVDLQIFKYNIKDLNLYDYFKLKNLTNNEICYLKKKRILINSVCKKTKPQLKITI
ncbi:MAG: hypothetical protein GY830_09555 [Bacteroidetes bacterium]|nr:hypothetical protein [Bacteroidota bacterium]